MLSEAKAADDSIREQLSLMLNVIAVGLAFVGVIISLLGVWGFVEVRKVKQIREEAKELTQNIEKHILAQVKTAIETAWSGLEPLFEELPLVGDDSQLASAPTPSISPDFALQWEEADALVTLGDKLNALGTPQKATAYFVRLADYWWVVESWPRATSRSQRAIALSPTSAEAHLAYATGLLNRARREQEAKIKLQVLADAERYLLTARRLKVANEALVLHHLGWTYDEREDYPKAIEYYRSALRIKNIPPESQAKYGYDLACTLAKAGQLREALDELKPIMSLEENWRLAETDADFDNIRNSPTEASELAKIIKEAKG